MNQGNIDKLVEIGFTKNLAAVYSYLLENDRVQAGRVIRNTGLQRSVVYGSLGELEKRGLATRTNVRGVATYYVNETGTLVHEIEEKSKIAAELVKEIESRRVRKNRTVDIYEGESIIRRIADKTLKTEKNETVYFLSPSKFGMQASLERYWQKYHKERIKAGLVCKILYDRSTDQSIVDNRNQMEQCQARYLPFGSNEPMWYIVAGDMVAMVIPAEKPPVAFVINSKYTARAITDYFEYLWEQAGEK